MALTIPTLDTDRLRLRPFADDDADEIYALHSDASVLRYWDSWVYGLVRRDRP
jgi:RimJ/RimL family protein N-acetyltransferase